MAIEIGFNPKNDPKSLAIEAQKRKNKAKKERNPYDSIWLFFDNDNWPQLEAAFQVIDAEGFHIAYSSMCMEHWFLLHFENCGKSFKNAEEALKRLKNKWPGYHKTKLKHYELLKNDLNTALERVKTLRSNVQTELPRHKRNPYFTMDLLIDFFRELEK